MADPATRWFEIVQYSDKHVDKITNLVEKPWLFRYPRPKIMAYNFRNEFLSYAFKNYLIKKSMELSLNMQLRKIFKQTTCCN